jgi:hypothetical protein
LRAQIWRLEVKRRSRSALGVSLAGALLAVVAPSPVSGAPPVGQCPQSFPDVITRAEALEIDGAVIFDAVNKNGDDIVCFKPFNNAPGGTLIDNTARLRS